MKKLKESTCRVILMGGGEFGSKTFWSHFQVLNDISGGQTIIPCAEILTIILHLKTYIQCYKKNIKWISFKIYAFSKLTYHVDHHGTREWHFRPITHAWQASYMWNFNKTLKGLKSQTSLMVDEVKSYTYLAITLC